MLKKTTCVCGQEMELKTISMRKTTTTYWIEAKYADDSHTCTLEGEFDEGEISRLFVAEPNKKK